MEILSHLQNINFNRDKKYILWAQQELSIMIYL